MCTHRWREIELSIRSDMEKCRKYTNKNQNQNQLERLEAKKKYWMGRRICKDIAIEILDNMESYMLSSMCHNIIVEH